VEKEKRRHYKQELKDISYNLSTHNTGHEKRTSAKASPVHKTGSEQDGNTPRKKKRVEKHKGGEEGVDLKFFIVLLQRGKD